MFPWDKKRERFPYPFENELRKLEEEMTDALDKGKGFSCGFTVVSVNGEPINQNFFKEQDVEETEPLVDIVEEKGQTKVIIDLPGVEKKDISLTTDDNVLEVKVDTEGRKYHKRIELPHGAKDLKAEYRNGVLEVSVKRDEPENVKVG